MSFKKGDRVRLTEKGRAVFFKWKSHTGTVASNPQGPALVSVLPDCKKSVSSYGADFWELDDKAEETVCLECGRPSLAASCVDCSKQDS